MESDVSHLLKSRSRFLGYVRRRLSDPDLAEDIVQECLLKAVRTAPEMRDEERLVRWFYRILQNAIIDTYRRRAAESNRKAMYALEAEHAALLQDERTICECINELIPMLKPEYAEVTVSELKGEEPDALARRLGITRNNLKVRIHRARHALRKRLEQTCRVCAKHHCLDCTCKESGVSHGHGL